jgi:hypothetical protein
VFKKSLVEGFGVTGSFWKLPHQLSLEVTGSDLQAPEQSGKFHLSTLGWLIGTLAQATNDFTINQAFRRPRCRRCLILYSPSKMFL